MEQISGPRQFSDLNALSGLSGLKAIFLADMNFSGLILQPVVGHSYVHENSASANP